MARTRIDLYDEPHVVEVGPHEFAFEPEVLGVEFAQAYADLQAAQSKLPQDPERLVSDVKAVQVASDSLRAFLAQFMTPESQGAFAEVLLPERALRAMFEWLVGVYGGEERPTGSSSASSTSSSQSGPRSTATSRSKASTPRRGRSAA